MSINAPRDYAKPEDMFSIDELPFGTGWVIIEALDVLLAKLSHEENVVMRRGGEPSYEARLRQKQHHVQAAKDTLEELMDDAAVRQGLVPTAEDEREMEIERQRDGLAEDRAFGH